MKKFILLLLLISQMLRAQDINIRGTVLSDIDKLPIGGTIIKIKNTTTFTLTDINGEFSLKTDSLPIILEVSIVGYQSKIIDIKANVPITIYLREAVNLLDEVYISTGYQRLSNEKATGSFTQVNNELLNRSVSSDIISRLEGVTNGLNFDRRYSGGAYLENGPPRLKLRGISTIEGNESPLIVVDNFPYDGTLENINPNDIESVTVLKDAAAASIWGAQAGNGVIVITTKRGKENQPMQISYRSNLTAEIKPNLFYSPAYLNSRDFLAVEYQLFKNNQYFESDYEVLTPFIEALFKVRREDGVLNDDKVQVLINELAENDARASARDHLYRNGFNQQHTLSLRGGQKQLQYYVAGGYDKNAQTLIGNSSSRNSITTNLTFNPVRDLYIDTQLNYIHNTSVDNGLPLSLIKSVSYKSLFPYALFADKDGNALSIPKDYRYSYVLNAMEKGSLDWTYKPLDEIYSNSRKAISNDSRFGVGIRYNILKQLNIEAKYQYFDS